MRKLALALVAAAAAAPLHAQTLEDDVPHATVSYRDLDLTTARGQARFRTRLHSAVNRICLIGEHVDLAVRRSRDECVTTARQSADDAFATAVASKGGKSSVQVAAR